MQRGRPPSLSCLTRAVTAFLSSGAKGWCWHRHREHMASPNGTGKGALAHIPWGKAPRKAAIKGFCCSRQRRAPTTPLCPWALPAPASHIPVQREQDLQMSPARRLGVAEALWEPSPSPSLTRPHPTQAGQPGRMLPARRAAGSTGHIPRTEGASLHGLGPSRHLQQLQRDEATPQDRDSILNLPLCKALISPG